MSNCVTHVSGMKRHPQGSQIMAVFVINAAVHGANPQMGTLTQPLMIYLRGVL
jgi:hypothetical protein